MISILMATYNGEAYISAQIDSLLAQTFQDFRLYVSDDCSSDSTYEILQSYQNRYPNKIFVSQREKNSGSAKCNFFDLMASRKDDYVMLCDQDDIWLPDKIELTLAKMKELESRYGADCPLLVHTDLTIVDENLKVLCPSYRRAMMANYDKTALKNAIIQNIITGCSAMYNGALAQLLGQAPSFMVMHDWWLMLVASAFGKIDHIDGQPILYRQHGHNSIGAQDMRPATYKLRRVVQFEQIQSALRGTYRQANSFLDLYRSQLTAKQIDLLERYCNIPKLTKVRRIEQLFRLGTLKNTLTRQIAHILFV